MAKAFKEKAIKLRSTCIVNYYPPMAEPITLILTPEVVASLIKLLTSLLERSASKESDFRTNLTIVKVDLGIVNDVLRVIQRRNQAKLPPGIKNWKMEAERVVDDVQKLLTRIDGNNRRRRPQLGEHEEAETIVCWPFRNGTAFRYSREDAQRLESFKKRLDSISKHNDTVLALLRQSRCFLL